MSLWMTAGAALVWAVVIGVAGSDGGLDEREALSWWILEPVLCAWLLGLGAWALAGAVLRRRRLGAVLRALGATGLAVAGTLVAPDLGFRLGFEASRDALDAAAAEVRARGWLPNLLVGRFHVQRVDTAGETVRLELESRVRHRFGLVHSPAGPPPAKGASRVEERYEHLSGPWWTWTATWTD